jgi:hypothetical protein
MDWVARFGKERLPHPRLDFWQVVLEKEYFIKQSKQIADSWLT